MYTKWPFLRPKIPVIPGEGDRHGQTGRPEIGNEVSPPGFSTYKGVNWKSREEMRSELPINMQSKRQFNRLVKEGVLIPYQIPQARGEMFDLEESLRRFDRFVRKFPVAISQRRE